MKNRWKKKKKKKIQALKQRMEYSYEFQDPHKITSKPEKNCCGLSRSAYFIPSDFQLHNSFSVAISLDDLGLTGGILRK